MVFQYMFSQRSRKEVDNMYKCEILREYWNYEDMLSSAIAECLNKNNVKRENIVDIKTFSENDDIYCMIIWEE